MRKLRFTVLVVCGSLSLNWGGSARADAVVDWNDITSQAIATASAAGRPGLVAVVDLAMVHAAVYDAVQAIGGRFEPYHVEIPGASGSQAAAAARAAHDVLLDLFPAQAESLGTTYHDYLASNGLSEDDPGVSVGEQAAAGIVALRANDGRFPPNPTPFVGGTGVGVWRPTPSFLPGPPPPLAPMATPWLATVAPFTLDGPAQFRAVPPPSLTSAEYTADYDEVKALGAFASSARTPEQTDLAYFYADNHVFLWNRCLRAIAGARIDSIDDSARLFALANLAIADGLITCWEGKIHYALWRPVTAIQEGDNDGNPSTAGDPAWQPLINNPNYPDYTSGANTVAGVTSRALALFFGTDEMTFSLTSNHELAVQKTRTYDRFSDAAQDVVDARIYLGIHFRFADTEARRQGREVADWAFERFLRPKSSRFIRGDADGGGSLGLTDASRILGHLFQASPPVLDCLDAADANDNGKIDISDPIFLLSFLFLAGPPLSAPAGVCGDDPTSDDMGCDVYPLENC